MDPWQLLGDAAVGAGFAALTLVLVGYVFGGVSMLFESSIGRGALVAGAVLGIVLNAGTLIS